MGLLEYRRSETSATSRAGRVRGQLPVLMTLDSSRAAIQRPAITSSPASVNVRLFERSRSVLIPGPGSKRYHPLQEPATQGSSPMFRKTVVVILTVVALFLASCSSPESDLTNLAEDTCNKIGSSDILDIFAVATSAAEDLGFSLSELGDEMREVCPDTMAIVLGTSDG